MLRALVKATPLLSAAVLTAACASSGARGGQPEWSPPCTQGEAVLIVRNESGGDVQIMESRIGSGGQTAVTVVGGGRHEVRIRNDSGYSYSAQRAGSAQVLAATSRPRLGDREVTLERECRPS